MNIQNDKKQVREINNYYRLFEPICGKNDDSDYRKSVKNILENFFAVIKLNYDDLMKRFREKYR